MPRLPRRLHAFLLALAIPLVGAGSATAAPAASTGPIAFGDASSSITLDSSGKQVVLRFVTDRAGTLAKIDLRAKLDTTACAPGGSPGYAKGSGGLLRECWYRGAASASVFVENTVRKEAAVRATSGRVSTGSWPPAKLTT